MFVEIVNDQYAFYDGVFDELVWIGDKEEGDGNEEDEGISGESDLAGGGSDYSVDLVVVGAVG